MGFGGPGWVVGPCYPSQWEWPGLNGGVIRVSGSGPGGCRERRPTGLHGRAVLSELTEKGKAGWAGEARVGSTGVRAAVSGPGP